MCFYGLSNSANRHRIRRASQTELSYLGEIPNFVECFAHNFLQPSVYLVESPAETLPVLHPLEVTNGNAACVGQHVRNNLDTFFLDNRIRVAEDRPVCHFDDIPCLDGACVFLSDHPFERCRDQDIDVKLQ